jgi:ankyrin repeat protein
VPAPPRPQHPWHLFAAQVKVLLERGASLIARDKRGLGPLHFAAGRGRLAVVELLWSKGVDLDADSPGADATPPCKNNAPQ